MTERLRRMVVSGRIPTALLFTGPRRVGRRATAIEFGRVLLCPDATDGVACGVCASCRRVSSKNHPDLDLWSVERQTRDSGASKSAALTIETVREIAASTPLRPYESDRRLVIVDDAETLGEDAQQALLKTLEDAPGYVSIILVANSPNAILDTVRSRSVEAPFQLVPTSAIESGLRRLHPDRDFGEIVVLAAGRPGWAITAIDDPGEVDREREANEAIEQWIASSSRDRMVEAYRRGDAVARDRTGAARQRQVRDLDTALLTWRDLLLVATGNAELAFDPTRLSRLDGGSRLDLRAAYLALTACRQCQFDLRHNVRPRLALELMVSQWPILS